VLKNQLFGSGHFHPAHKPAVRLCRAVAECVVNLGKLIFLTQDSLYLSAAYLGFAESRADLTVILPVARLTDGLGHCRAPHGKKQLSNPAAGWMNADLDRDSDRYRLDGYPLAPHGLLNNLLMSIGVSVSPMQDSQYQPAVYIGVVTPIARSSVPAALTPTG